MKMTIQSIKKTAAPIFKKHGIIRASLFGSMVRGDEKKTSDIDFLIELPQEIDGLDYFGVMIDLKEDLEEKFGRKVDVVPYNSIKPALKKYILPEHKYIYKQ